MKEAVELTAVAQKITEALPRGILLNTNGDKFNTMVIGWGAVGTVWSRPAFTVYVRENRYTKSQLDRTGEFTVSIPLGEPDPEINRICGRSSGRDVDKVLEAKLELETPLQNHTPGVRQYPLTLECRVLYAQRQDPSVLDEEIRRRMYPEDVDGTNPMANRDPHTMYIGQVVAAYVIR